jgi:hypothetical protein
VRGTVPVVGHGLVRRLLLLMLLLLLRLRRATEQRSSRLAEAVGVDRRRQGN